VRARSALAGVVCAAMLAGCGTTRYYVRPGHTPAVPGPDDRFVGRLILVGDAGDVRASLDPRQRETDRTFDAIRGDAARDAERTTVVWLGDNVYPRGLPLHVPDPCANRRRGDATPQEAEAVLRRQIAASAPAALALFVPGNHDWDRSGECGLPRVLAQERFVEGATPTEAQPWPRRVSLLPDGGCPGPAWLDLPEKDPAFRVIALNSEWLLRDPGKDGQQKPVAECAPALGLKADANEAEVRAAVLSRLREAVAGSGGRPVVLTMHHPLKTHGQHAGAGLIGLQARFFPTRQDVRNDVNRRMVRDVLSAVGSVPDGPLVVSAAGHDHGLQVLDFDLLSLVQLVSGAGSQLSTLGRGPDTRFAHRGHGYVRIDFVRREGRPLARAFVIGTDERGPHQLWVGWLKGPRP
jgi:hypothetical protein